MKGFPVIEYPGVTLATVNHVTLESTIAPVDYHSILADMLEENSIQEVL